MSEKNIFGRNRGVGFQLERPMAVGALHLRQCVRRARHAGIHPGKQVNEIQSTG